MPDTSVPPCMSLMPFNLLPPHWSSEGVSQGKSVHRPFKRNCQESSSLSFHSVSPHLFLLPEVMATALPGTRTLGWDPSLLRCPAPFLSASRGCRISLFWVSAPATIHSVVYSLIPFSSISDGSEWWLFFSLVVVLMWLCEEVSRVYLHCHLD